MTISKIVPINILNISGIHENTPEFDNTERSFSKGQELKEGNYVYKRVGDDLFAEEFNPNKETYNVGDVVYRNSKLHYIASTTGAVAKQPEEYASIDTDVDSTTWQNRYLKLNMFTQNNIKKYIKEIDSNTIYIYSLDTQNNTFSIFKYTNPTLTGNFTTHNDCTDCNDSYTALVIGKSTKTNKYVYILERKYCMRPPSGGCDTIITDTHRATDKEWNELQTDNILPTGSVIYIEGLPYKVGPQINGSYYKFYRYNRVGYDWDVTIYNNSSLDRTEEKATTTSDRYIWQPRTIIIRNNIPYIRTSVSAPIETKTVTDVQTEELVSLTEQINWGWPKYRPTKPYAPFDNKKYTTVVENNEIVFKLKGLKTFDTVALNGVIAGEIVVIKGSEIKIIPTNNLIYRPLENKMLTTKTTYIIYLNNQEATEVEIKLRPLSGLVEVGGVYLGDRIVAGFTNLNFKNSFIDYSPYGKDQWGNIEYKEGVKVRVFEGNADIELNEYDDINPLLQDFLGKKAIFDGSDNLENKKTDSKNYFASTLIVGRVRNFEQETLLENDELSQIARYSFRVEEDV